MPVSADDVTLSVRLAVDALGAAGDGWDRQAGEVTWTCWETAEHVADDLFFYATQIARTPPPEPGEAPFTMTARRDGGPVNAVSAVPESGPAGLLAVVDACGALLAAAVRAAPPDARGHHVFGLADAEGFAAMGVVEVLVHTSDIAAGLGVPWQPPADLCARVLTRLFPDVEVTGDPWRTLLWATGRAELPGRPRRTRWRWHSAPIASG
ncbi:maleylpyruvate isomerase N-terminal domain-containing protein [Actinophytocola glycyrrhizae]|uniref:Maleylpyruvate isomerase N-terminal domain-containing protein n=1 Tax=Actinophytocola glycyrrhizae TaxID=2044873 RepID=A0ABV9S8U0_9PSEU